MVSTGETVRRLSGRPTIALPLPGSFVQPTMAGPVRSDFPAFPHFVSRLTPGFAVDFAAGRSAGRIGSVRFDFVAANSVGTAAGPADGLISAVAMDSAATAGSDSVATGCFAIVAGSAASTTHTVSSTSHHPDTVSIRFPPIPAPEGCCWKYRSARRC